MAFQIHVRLLQGHRTHQFVKKRRGRLVGLPTIGVYAVIEASQNVGTTTMPLVSEPRTFRVKY
jgi:hypothetical protein